MAAFPPFSKGFPTLVLGSFARDGFLSFQSKRMFSSTSRVGDETQELEGESQNPSASEMKAKGHGEWALTFLLLFSDFIPRSDLMNQQHSRRKGRNSKRQRKNSIR